MNKIWTIAAAEFGMLVRTKTFLITLLFMPLLWGGSILVQTFVAGRVDTTPRRFAVLDHSGKLYPAIARAAAERSEGARYSPEELTVTGDAALDALRLEQSERVRRKEITAFVELPADAFAATGAGAISYHSDTPTYGELRQWIEKIVNLEVAQQRLRGAGIDPAVVAGLARPIATDNLGLVERGPDGAVRPGTKADLVRTFAVPIALMIIMFMIIFTGVPQLMTAVVQEKISKISEVLLGSVSSFELMMGKLIGSAGGALVLSLVYVGGGYAFAAYSGYASAVSTAQLAWFVLFMVLAVLFYGSLFIAIGAACSDMKDAQTMMMPVMVVAMMPVFAWQVILKSPATPAAIALTLVPWATPFMMVLRVSVQPAPPLWHVVASVVVCGAATVGLVWAAGRIFRIGVLAHGKSATFGEMVRWLRVR